MQIITKKDAKTAVSALRRELKTLGKGPDQLSHSDCLTILAKALGHTSWNEWEAKLVDEAPVAAVPPAAPQPSRYPLRNEDGRFDFVPRGAEGMPYSSWFERLQGRYEQLHGTALADTAQRSNGTLHCHGTYTKVDWDSQTPYLKDGNGIWVSDSGDFVSESRIVLLPEEYYQESRGLFEDEDLPMRETMVSEFVEYFDTHGTAELLACTSDEQREKVFGKAEKVVGFWMTHQEQVEVLSRLQELPETMVARFVEYYDIHGSAELLSCVTDEQREKAFSKAEKAVGFKLTRPEQNQILSRLTK
jgi:hypothetical protein